MKSNLGKGPWVMFTLPPTVMVEICGEAIRRFGSSLKWKKLELEEGDPRSGPKPALGACKGLLEQPPRTAKN